MSAAPCGPPSSRRSSWSTTSRTRPWNAARGLAEADIEIEADEAHEEVELDSTSPAGGDHREPADLPERGRPAPPAHRRRGGHARQARRARRSRRQGAHGQLQPAPGRLDRQALPRPRPAAPRPDPGRRHRPQPRGREVRLPQGLQVLDLRDVVDPPGLPARGREPGRDTIRVPVHVVGAPAEAAARAPEVRDASTAASRRSRSSPR